MVRNALSTEQCCVWLISGSLFSHAPSLSREDELPSTPAHALNDVDLRQPNEKKQQIHIDLTGAEWLNARDCCDGPNGAALLRAVLHSNRKATTRGFESAFAAHVAKMDASNIERVSSTRVTITLPPWPGYKLPVSRVEQITAQAIPSSVTTAGREIKVLRGSHSVVVFAAAMQAHGSFFDHNSRTDDEMRTVPAGGLHTVRIDLEGARWSDDINLPETRQKLLSELLVSDMDRNAKGAAGAFSVAWSLAVSAGSVGLERESQSRIVVTVPLLEEYSLPAGGQETITLGKIPSAATSSSHDITEIDPTDHPHGYKVTYHDRRAVVSGTFFGRKLTQQEVISGNPPLTVSIELTGAEWMHDIAENPFRRSELAASLFTPITNVHPGGAPATAWVNNFSPDNVTEIHVTLLTPRKLTVRLPPIERYAAPGRVSEDFAVDRIPKDLLKRAHSDIPGKKVFGKTKAEIYATKQAQTEL